jgi:hypothetical protein
MIMDVSVRIVWAATGPLWTGLGSCWRRSVAVCGVVPSGVYVLRPAAGRATRTPEVVDASLMVASFRHEGMVVT